MSDVLLHSRAEVFGPNLFPTSLTGLVRPALKADRPTLTVHYVGSGTFTDRGDTPSEIRAIHAYSVSPSKRTPWEYNYVVDSDGELWTYAGEREAAHSAGENHLAVGVLMLAGLNDAPTEAMILGFRKLRWMLREVGLLGSQHSVVPHGQMPGAQTSCPGPATLARWADLVVPWSPQPDPQPIDTEDDMLAVYQPTFIAPPGYDPAWFVVFGSGIVRRATNPDVVLAARLGAPTLPLDSPDQYRELLRASGSAYPTLP